MKAQNVEREGFPFPEPTGRSITRSGKGACALHGFTLIEMMVVLAILILIASLLFPAVQTALAKAKERKCMAQMKSMGQVWFAYYTDIAGAAGNLDTDRVYPWLSDMHPDPIGAPNQFICPSDRSAGASGSKPNEPRYEEISGDENQYTETDDLTNNPEISRNSYMYEFCEATCSWWQDGNWGSEWGVLGPGGEYATDDLADKDGNGVSWAEAKFVQLKYGDTYSQGGYDANQFPVIRCFHHYDDRPVRVADPDDGLVSKVRVLNIAITSRFFISGPQWEYPLAD